MKFPEFISRHLVRTALSLSVVILLLLHASGAFQLGFINRLENFSYDLRLNFMMPETVDPRIVIVDIDERSLQEQGRWPWGRHKLAGLVDKLFDDYAIDVLGFDVVFAEKDESSGLQNLEDIRRQHLRSDTEFAGLLEKLR